MPRWRKCANRDLKSTICSYVAGNGGVPGEGEDFGGGWGVRGSARWRRQGGIPVGPHSDAAPGEQRHGYSHIGGECGHDIVTGPTRPRAAGRVE
jgi:hypothetical protein